MEIINTNFVRHVYHLADIHVRKNPERESEYIDAFKKTCDVIRGDCENSLIVIAGDVFHDSYSATAIKLVKEFFVALGEISDIVVFRGNHDQANKSDNGALDYLSPILYKLRTKNNIYLLEKSGAYQYGNIIFGYTDVYDNQIFRLPNENYEGKIKIGLWHGSCGPLSHSKNHNAFHPTNFSDYDIVMLGDIHTHHYVNEDRTIAYAGSLIQQNYGEELRNHGLIKWDLNNRKSEFMPIESEYGHITININSDKYEIPPEIPKYVNLRIVYSDSCAEIINKIRDKISSVATIQSYKEKKSERETVERSDITIMEDNGQNQTETLCETLMNYINKNLNCESDKIDNIKGKLMQIFEETMQKPEYSRRVVKLNYIVFNNFNLFGQHNVIDYNAFRGIVNFNGKNGIGKSTAAVQVLLYAIYGKMDEVVPEYINNKQRAMSTIICANVNGRQYIIKRLSLFRDKLRKNANCKSSVILLCNGADISEKDNTCTNQKIISIIGDPDEFINTCIMEQGKNTGFIDFSDTNRKKYITSIANLDTYEKICEKLAYENRVGVSKIKDCEEKIYPDVKNKCVSRIEQKNTMLNEFHGTLSHLQNVKRELTGKFSDICERKMRISLKLNELSQYASIEISDLDELTRRLDEYTTKKEEFEAIMNDCEIAAAELNSKLSTYDATHATHNIHDKKRIFDLNKKMHLDRLHETINTLWMEYADTSSLEIEVLEFNKYKSIMENEIKLNEKNITDANEKLERLSKLINDYDGNVDLKKKYCEYLELSNKYSKMRDNVETLEIKLTNVNKLVGRDAKKYNDITAQLNALTEKRGEMHDKIVKIKNKRLVDATNNKKRLDELQHSRDALLKRYKKIGKIDNTLQEQLKAELAELRKTKKSISSENKVLITKAQHYELPNDALTKYDEYINAEAECSTQRQKYTQIEHDMQNAKQILDKYKNHKYNAKCDACMANPITAHIIDAGSKIKELEGEHENTRKYLRECDDKLSSLMPYKDTMKIIEILKDCDSRIKMNDEKLSAMDANITIRNTKMRKLQQISNDAMRNKKIQDTLSEIDREMHELTKDGEKNINDMENECEEIARQIIKLHGDVEPLKMNIALKNGLCGELDEIKKDAKIMLDMVNSNKIYEKKYFEYESNVKMHRQLTNKIAIMISENNKTMERLDASEKLDKTQRYNELKRNNAIVMGKIGAIKEDICTISNEKLQEYEEYTDINAKFRDINNKKSECDGQIKEHTIMILKLERDIELASKNKINKEKYAELKREFNNVMELHDSLEGKVNDNEENIRRLENQIEQLKRECALLDDYMTTIIELGKNRQLNDDIIDIIRNKFIGDMLNNTIMQEIKTMANNILSEFVSFKVDMICGEKTIKIDKIGLDGKRSCATKMSGYEKLMTNIVFRMAINEWNRRYGINFFIIDEGFSYCDDNAIEKMEGLFEYMRKKYAYVIVVTHNEQLKTYMDRTITFQSLEGYSQINMISENNKEIIERHKANFESITNLT